MAELYNFNFFNFSKFIILYQGEDIYYCRNFSSPFCSLLDFLYFLAFLFRSKVKLSQNMNLQGIIR